MTSQTLLLVAAALKSAASGTHKIKRQQRDGGPNPALVRLARATAEQRRLQASIKNSSAQGHMTFSVELPTISLYDTGEIYP